MSAEGLYYAPRYFGSDGGAVYGELNGAQRGHDRVRLLAHVGILQINGGNPYSGWPDHRVFDGRAGVAFDIDPFNVQLSWVGISAATRRIRSPHAKPKRYGADAVLAVLDAAFFRLCLRAIDGDGVRRVLAPYLDRATNFRNGSSASLLAFPCARYSTAHVPT